MENLQSKTLLESKEFKIRLNKAYRRIQAEINKKKQEATRTLGSSSS